MKKSYHLKIYLNIILSKFLKKLEKFSPFKNFVSLLIRNLLKLFIDIILIDSLITESKECLKS